MGRMVRKQVYIEPRHEALLKRRAEEWAMSEAEIVRYALDELPATRGPENSRRRAWEEIKAFILEHRMMDVPQTGRTWTRDELYEERLAKWGPDLYDLTGQPISRPPDPDKG